MPHRRLITRFSALAAFAWLAGAYPARADLPSLPALSDPPTQERHAGKIVFTELVTPDLEAAKEFYGGLFGWTFQDIRSGRTEYAEAFLDGHPVAGLIHRAVARGEHRQPAWLTFISSPDADAAERAALQKGAKLLFGPKDIPGRGREAVMADPQGAVFAVVSSESGDPPDVLPSSGEWIWSSLITTDPDAGAAFYQALFDYDVFDLPSQGGTRHLLLGDGGYARASANGLPSSRSHPHWLNYVRVDDVDHVAARAEELGGHVLVKPHPDRHGGKIAVVADPSGAAFGLMEWPNARTRKVRR